MRFRLKPQHWGWLHFKLALIVWAIAFLVVRPVNYNSLSDASIALWCFGTLVGGLVSMTGLIVTTLNIHRVAVRGLLIELIGVVLLYGGVFQFFLVQVGFMIAEGDEGFQSRFALSCFAYALMAAVFVRLIMLVSTYRKLPRGHS